MSIDNCISGFLYWLAAGSFLWAMWDPARLRQLFIEEHLDAFGYLPPRWKLFFAHCGAIVVLPVIGALRLVNLHRRVWR